MACEHAWRRQPPAKGSSGLEISVCVSCDERRVDGKMGSPASYFPPSLFARLEDERPDLFKEWVTRPRDDRAERRAAVRRLMGSRGNGKTP